MDDNTRRKLEKFEKELAYMQDNAPDFPAGSGATGEAVRPRSYGSAARCAEMAPPFRELTNEVRGSAALFTEDSVNAGQTAAQPQGSFRRFPVRRSRHRSSTGTARRTAAAFHEDSVAPYEAKFIEYGLAATLRADLTSCSPPAGGGVAAFRRRGGGSAAFDAAGTSADTSEAQRAGATGGLKDAARRGMTNSNKLNAIVRIKYQNNPQKLAAWISASHIEKAPKRTTPPTP